MRRLRSRENVDVFVIGSERMLDQADVPEFEREAPGIADFRDPEVGSLKRKAVGRVLAAATIVAVVSVMVSLLGGRGGDEPSSAGDELAARQAPRARDRVASTDTTRPGTARAIGAAAKPTRARASDGEPEASRSRPAENGRGTAPVPEPGSNVLGEETSPVAPAPPVAESPPMAPALADPAGSGDGGGAVVPASGAEVRQEFGP